MIPSVTSIFHAMITQYYACYAVLRMLRSITQFFHVTQTLRRHYALILQYLRSDYANITQILRNVYAYITQVYTVITQSLRSDYALLHRHYACYAVLCMLRRFMRVTQSLRRHYAGITQSLGHLPLSDNYAVLHSHYAELRNGHAVIHSVTQCYTV